MREEGAGEGPVTRPPTSRPASAGALPRGGPGFHAATLCFVGWGPSRRAWPGPGAGGLQAAVGSCQPAAGRSAGQPVLSPEGTRAAGVCKSPRLASVLQARQRRVSSQFFSNAKHVGTRPARGLDLQEGTAGGGQSMLLSHLDVSLFRSKNQ